MAKVNHFSTLGLQCGASFDEIKKAYRTLAKKWHPDKNNADGAKEKFQKIASAYEYLSSQNRRELHERDLQKSQKSTFPNTSSQYTPSASEPSANKTGAKPATSKTSEHSSSNSNSNKSTNSRKKTNAGSWSESFTRRFRQQGSKAQQTNDGYKSGK